LAKNVTVSGVAVTTSIIPVPTSSEEDSDLSTGQAAGLVIGITVGVILLSGLVYFLLLKIRSKHRQFAVNTGEIAIDITKVHDYHLNQSDNFGMNNAPTEAKI
jgi:hypothetical protein